MEWNDLTVQYEEGGIALVEELDKKILSKGTWSTVLFKFREWNHTTQDYGAPKFGLRRYQKIQGEYRIKARFNISSAAQAKQLAETLNAWLGQEAGA